MSWFMTGPLGEGEMNRLMAVLGIGAVLLSTGCA